MTRSSVDWPSECIQDIWMGEKRIAIRCVLIFSALFALVVLVSNFVWIPDVILRTENVLARMELPNGHRFEATQQWNGVDFYSIYLRVFDRLGREEYYVVDPDNLKKWTLEITRSGDGKYVRVVDRGKIKATFDVDALRLFNESKIEVEPIVRSRKEKQAAN